MQPYLHNSAHKEFIRDKWVEYMQENLDDEEFGIITFPAEEMHDLYLFKQKGLIDWEENETGNITITKGKVICFEKSTKIYRKLREKLVNASVESDEIGSFLRNKYQSIMNGHRKVFPVHAINLDYDGSLAKNRVPIKEKIELIFKYQANYSINFSLFLTWPCSETEDTDEYKEILRKTIKNNLEDPSATSFEKKFRQEKLDINSLNYDELSIIGLSKLILRISSNSYYKLHKNEFYIYGGEDRRKMYSILLNFTFIGDGASQNKIYSEDVERALSSIQNLNDLLHKI